jgi:hypothetical protein
MKKYFWPLVLSWVFCFIFGLIAGGTFVYTKFENEYHKILQTNIGGFVLKEGRLYSLEELKVR